MERRKTYLWRENMVMIGFTLSGQNCECFHFGSQSEGTTIPGLKSDIDFLTSSTNINIMRVWGDWEYGIVNALMLKDDIGLPQQYLLQAIRNNTPEPETSLRGDMFVRKDSGEVLISAERHKQIVEYTIQNKEEITRNGPSVSNSLNWDMVIAVHVCKPLPEIQH
ncbi:hypothetical protein DPMN_045926 [Dreissena polymorpha]|uniref:Uncharacterized protein n=1 Tax=Dreissena polymorpha TaxID=45954 RepID=A0A9D4D506_DREPO|nr:hypothetical protein DPMN_045926 [Dreissena polymorpha]